MSRTTRNHRRFTKYSNKESMLKQQYISRWTGEVSTLYDEDYWDRLSRDKDREGSSKKDYRSYTNEIIRNKNRMDMVRIKSDPDNYENMVFATKADGKPLIWSIW